MLGTREPPCHAVLLAGWPRRPRWQSCYRLWLDDPSSWDVSPPPQQPDRCATVTYERLTRFCSKRRYVTAARRGRSPLGPPAGAARLPRALENPRRDPPGTGCRLTRCDGAPRGWPTIPMAWASARGIASECRWPLRRGSSTRFGGGTSVAPPSQERPARPGCYGSRRTLQELDALGCDAVQGYDVSRPVPLRQPHPLAPAAGGNAKAAAPAMKAGSPTAPPGSLAKLSSPSPRSALQRRRSVRVPPTSYG
jgi:hypothetical protein